MTDDFSDYIVYVDESGDHSTAATDLTYPFFVLAFCIFRKDEYMRRVVPAFQALKFSYFGHDLVAFHERDIRKELGPFSILRHPARRHAFMTDLNEVVREAPFTVVAAAIDKREFPKQYGNQNLYHVAVGFCLERLRTILLKGPGTLHVVFEGRGHVEDRELELEFRRLRDAHGDAMKPVFANKHTHSTGLQLADLVARPIGRHVMNPGQPNRAYDIIAMKFYGGTTAAGLRLFP